MATKTVHASKKKGHRGSAKHKPKRVHTTHHSHGGGKKTL